MKIEWDEQKNQINIRKHGIDFEDVAEIFDHPMLVMLDTRQDYGEERSIGIGFLCEHVAVVVFIEWEDEDRIRIISARKATRHEEKNFRTYLANRLGSTS